jgi:hypothetical protein
MPPSSPPARPRSSSTRRAHPSFRARHEDPHRRALAARQTEELMFFLYERLGARVTKVG